MNKLSDLIEKYPEAFNGHFYFECGDGWYDIIEPIIKAIHEYNLVSVYKNYPSQVKEKFGGLRFYLDASSDEIDELISIAEDRSETTCEVCGNPGKTYRYMGWISTACSDHERK